MKKLLVPSFLVLIFILFSHPFEGSGDFYHHANTGKFVIQNHQLPNLDIWSHTQLGQPWIAHSWASGVIFYFIFQALGPIGISIFSALLAVILFYLLYLLIKSFGVSTKINLLTLLLVVAPISTRWPQRPELFSYPFAITLLLIDRLRVNHPRLVILWPILILGWANLYGSGVILGLGLIGLIITKQLWINRFKIKPSQRLFYALSICTFPLSLINGYGLKTIFYVFLYIPQVSVYEGEWLSLWGVLTRLPTGLLITYQYYILIYLVVFILFILLVIFSWPVIKKNSFNLLIGLTIFAPILAFRQLPMASILVAPALALTLQYQTDKKRYVWPILALVLAILLNLIIIWLNQPRLLTDKNQTLLELTDYIKTNQLSGKAFNQNAIGAYLTYQFYPNILVFFDTRDDLYTNSPALNDLYSVSNSGESVIPLLNKYQINLVIADYNQDQVNYRDLFYDPNWSVVFFNNQFLIAVPRQIAASKHLPVIDSIDPYSSSGAKPGLESKAIDYYQQELSHNPNSSTIKALLASSLLATKQFTQATQVISSIQIDQRSPQGPLALQDKELLLAEAYLGQNDCNTTKLYLNRAQSLSQPILLPFIHQDLSNKSNKILGFYTLVCLKDPIAAQNYLEKYLSQPGISPLEKVKIYKQFNDLSR